MARADRKSVVKHADVVERTVVEAGTATEMQMLIGPDDGAPNFAMRRFIMGSGGGMPRHTNEVEHVQYVLRGKARIGIAERMVRVAAGDVLFIPAGQPHYYQVEEAPFEFLCMVPNRQDQVRLVTGDDEDRER